MENEKDIRLLQSRFSTATEIHSHKDSNGNTAQCCKIAQLTMESSIIACASKSGLSGVLDYLQSKFRWGLRQEKYYCNCLKADSLACGASTAIACWALEYFRDIDMLSAYDGRNFSVVAVQTIDQCSAENANLWRSEIKKRGDDSAKWICDSCNFHECIGIVDMKTRELSVWDFGEWRRPYSSRGTEGALLSIRLDTRCIGNATKLQDYRQLTSSKVNWDGFEMEFEKWTEVPSEASLCPLSILAQTNILGNIYSLNPETDAFKKSDTPVVYISGVQMGVNPCAGVSVARSIRHQFPFVTLVAVDDGGGPAAGGMSDPIFDRVISTAIMGGTSTLSHGSKEEKFEAAMNMIITEECAYFLPCRDQDVAAMASGKAAVMNNSSSLGNGEGLKNTECYRKLCGRILSPSLEAVELSKKPNILCESKSTLKNFFQIPEYLCLAPETTSWVGVQAFAERVGYPLVVKGATQGCVLCHNWFEISSCLRQSFSTGGFVQKHVYGSDITVAFAAYEGELTGCVRMTKETYTDVGKVWDGRISPVCSKMTNALEEFVTGCNWTGGGELEMIEDLSGSLWMIDFNVRFPAWIFASSFSGCNLPAMLIEHAMYNDSIKNRILADGSKPDCYSILPGKREASQNAGAAFTRSTIEIPRSNITIERTMRLPTCILSNHAYQNKGGRTVVTAKNDNPIPILPARTLTNDDPNTADENYLNIKSSDLISDDVDKVPANSTSKAVAGVVQSVENDVAMLCAAAFALLESGPCYTPRRILCMTSVAESLERHQKVFEMAARQARLLMSKSGTRMHPIDLQLCLSVKTQPHQAVLMAAGERQYVAECISLAEVHASLAAGFTIEQIVLTGPGKFYDISGAPNPRPLSGPLRAIFADSLADLKVIMKRVRDPNDWLDCNIVGVRWIPSWHVLSRFGLDPKDPDVVMAAADLLKDLPEGKGVGMHFHFASSTVGADTWFGLAKAFCHFSAQFTKIINRPIAAIDFGGGWSPHFYLKDSGSNNSGLISILQSIYSSFNPVQSVLPSVQFEPGKCITEAAGGIITRILDIREVPHENKKMIQHSEEGKHEEGDDDKTMKAIIVDTCIAEVSSPHIHPIFWKPKSTIMDHHGWVPLDPGKSAIWGRTCMEFDLLPGTFQIPTTMQPGDYLLVAATGSYDFTNSYDFGDGIARLITLV